MKSFLEVDDLTVDELHDVLDRSESSALGRPLAGKGVALYFEKPSLRTRHSGEPASTRFLDLPVRSETSLRPSLRAVVVSVPTAFESANGVGGKATIPSRASAALACR